jgi:hypothetical protein
MNLNQHRISFNPCTSSTHVMQMCIVPHIL